MISCLLVLSSPNPAGSPVRNEIHVAGESIELGRGSACQIHLPDQRVSLLHATLKQAANGALEIEAAEDVSISINGCMKRCAALTPGTRIGIGPYLLTVERLVDNTNLTLAIDMPELPAQNSQSPTPLAPMSLAALGIGKRRLGVALAGFILVALLALPMLSRVSPAFETWQAGLPFKLTEWLSPGALSAGHGLSGARCSSCHQRAFQAVADTACTECHRQLALHLAGDPLHLRAVPTMRCAACHALHQDKADAIGYDIAQCLGCHQRLGSTVADVSDFAAAHPEFSLSVIQGMETVRVRQGETKLLLEKPGLKFSHQIHLAPKGLSTPEGDTVLNCRNCHKLEESGKHFAPMKMEQTCQQSRCHKQRFAEPVGGIVPHGAEREVMGLLRNFYATRLAAAPVEYLRQCGEIKTAGNVLQRSMECAESLVRTYAAATLFRASGENLECALCHEITATGKSDIPWRVLPVRINRDWQPKAIFDHARHDTVACVKCHDKADSKSSQDVALPNIEKCRECHAGATGAAGKLESNCQSCHPFHRIVEKPS